MSMIVFSYLRVSSKGQVDGDGPDRQRDAIAAFCAANKLILAGEFFEAISGTVDGADRPVFSDMIEKAKELALNGMHIGAVVVERADRLARDLLVSEMLLAECRKRGIQVFAADRGVLDIATNEGDPTHKLIRQVIAAVAEFEKSALVKKLRLSRERVRREKGRCEGAKPFGTLPAEKEIMHYMKTVCREDSGYQEIADSLNAVGLRNRRGNRWTRGQIYTMLERRRAAVRKEALMK